MSSLPGPSDVFLQRLALLMLSLNPARDRKLLGGLSESLQAAAARIWEGTEAMCPGERRVLTRDALGVRKDADLRLRRAMAQASPELRRALYECLPPFFRSIFPESAPLPGAGKSPHPRPELRAFAQRVAWEALR